MRLRPMLCTAIILFSSLTVSLVSAEVLDKIEVVVNDEIITRSEIDRLLAPIYQQYKTVYAGDELVAKLVDARQRVIQQLIDDRLILSEAKKLNIQVEDKEVDAKIEEVATRMGSKEAFEEALRQQGITAKDLKNRYREQLIARKLIDQNVGSRIVITPVEVDQYYRNNSKQFIQPEEVKIRNILIRADPDPKKALILARSVLAQIKSGADFGELANTYSQGPNAFEGGLMGYVKKGDLLPDIEKKIFELKDGEVSELIQSSLGYHIFKLEEKRPARTLSLADAKDRIEEEIFKEKARDKIKGWVEGLKKNAYIAFK